MSLSRRAALLFSALLFMSQQVMAAPDLLPIEFERVDGEIQSLTELVASDRDAGSLENELVGMVESAASTVHFLEKVVAERGLAPLYGARLIDLRSRLERLIRDLAESADPGRQALAALLAPEAGTLLPKLVQEITGRRPTGGSGGSAAGGGTGSKTPGDGGGDPGDGGNNPPAGFGDGGQFRDGNTGGGTTWGDDKDPWDIPRDPPNVPVSGEPLGWNDSGGGPLRGTDSVALGVRSLTRWEACKLTLTKMFRAYLEKDVSGFLNFWTPDGTTDLTILRNAAMADFAAESQINIDLELLEYRMSMGTVRARFRWNRSAILQINGQLEVTRGTTAVYFDRHQNFSVKQMTGRVPFGLRDAALQDQVQAGQPNDSEDELIPEQALTQADLKTAAITLDHFVGGAGNVAFLDAETGAVRKVQSVMPMTVPGASGEDFRIWIPLGFPPAATDVRIDALGAAQVAACPANVPFGTFNGVSSVGLGTSANTGQAMVFGATTDQSRYLLFQLADLAQVTYLLSDTPGINPAGSQSCP